MLCISGADTSHTEEVPANHILDYLLAVPDTPAGLTQSVAGGFQAMPPVTSLASNSTPLHTSTPDIVPLFPPGQRSEAPAPFVFGGAEVTPVTAPLPTPLSTNTTPAPPPVSQIFAPPTMPAPNPSLPDVSTPSTGSLTAAILPPPTSTPASQLPALFRDTTLPQFSFGAGQSFEAQSEGRGGFSNVPSAAMYTPANQGAAVTTPQAPRMDRFQSTQNTRRWVLWVIPFLTNFNISN